MVGHRGQASQHVGQIFLRVDATAPAALDDGVDNCTAPTCVGMTDEEPAVSTNDRRPYIILYSAVSAEPGSRVDQLQAAA